MVLNGGLHGIHKYSEPEINKARDFIASLLLSPELKSGSPIWCERIIVKYLENNISELRKKLHESGFPAFMKADQALDLVYRGLYGMVSEKTLPVINRFIEESDFSFLDRTYGSGAISDEFRKARLYDFVSMVFEQRSARYHMNGLYNILYYGVLERYSSEIFRRGNLLHLKLFKEQDIASDQREFIILLKVLLLIKNAAYISNPAGSSVADPEIKAVPPWGNREKLKEFIESRAGYVSIFLTGIPQTVIKLALESNFPDSMVHENGCIPGFLFILNSMYQNRKNIIKPDRGAEGPDKSWFRLVGNNSLYFGYDTEMLGELEIIAGENNW